MKRRLSSLGLLLALLFGLPGTTMAAGPATDPVSTGNPPPPTDPAGDFVPWRSPLYFEPIYQPPDGVATAGTALSGTYVGEVGKRRYIPAFQYQLIYSDPQGGYSCTAYSAAMAVDKATYGGSRVTGRQLRALSGVVPYTGMTLADIERGTDRVYVDITRGLGTWSDVLIALRAGRGVILQGVYSQVPANLSGQLSFKGRHAIYLDYLHSSGDYVYVMDPLSKVGPRWWPAAVLQKFAERLSRDTGVYPLVYYSHTRAVRLVR